MIIIHHGTGVESGLAEALEGKKPCKAPYENLKTDSVRDLVDTFSKIWPIDNPVLVAWPLDEADPSVLDILLKRIEEPLEGSPSWFSGLETMAQYLIPSDLGAESSIITNL